MDHVGDPAGVEVAEVFAADHLRRDAAGHAQGAFGRDARLFHQHPNRLRQGQIGPGQRAVFQRQPPPARRMRLPPRVNSVSVVPASAMQSDTRNTPCVFAAKATRSAKGAT